LLESNKRSNFFNCHDLFYQAKIVRIVNVREFINF
jgi:hypothetical protein